MKLPTVHVTNFIEWRTGIISAIEVCNRRCLVIPIFELLLRPYP